MAKKGLIQISEELLLRLVDSMTSGGAKPARGARRGRKRGGRRSVKRARKATAVAPKRVRTPRTKKAAE